MHLFTDSAAKAFTDPEGDYQIVINLAGETKLSQEDTVSDNRHCH